MEIKVITQVFESAVFIKFIIIFHFKILMNLLKHIYCILNSRNCVRGRGNKTFIVDAIP